MQQRHIVIIEDDESLVRLLGDVLNQENFKITLALPTLKHLEQIVKQQPALIILDVMLPGESGFEFLEELKANRRTKHIPVVILSNLGQDAEIRRAKTLGAVDYIVKSDHSIEEIIQRIKRIIPA